MLAIYIRSVASLPLPDGYKPTLAVSGSAQSTKAVEAHNAPCAGDAEHATPTQHGQDRASDNASFPQAAMVAQELESIKQVASYQMTVVATESLTHLAFRGYGLQDLAAWHWILSGKTAEEAALRFEILLKRPGPHPTDFGTVPIFVFLRLLRRTDVNLRALILFIRQAWRILGSFDQRKLDSAPEVTLQSTSSRKPLEAIGLDALILLVVRLLRHARTFWPASCVSIAQLWITHARLGRGIRQKEQDIMTEKDTVRLSFCYNRILSILSLPPNESAYQSLHHRQRAQFMVIRRMNAFSPPLTINREGYRGVVRVQLAHRKTHRERKWARLKAKSWPPWKEDKLGMDASVGVEYGVSRASDSLRQMAEAGYGSGDWEKAAGILAGWDTDRSPTIQKRSVIIPDSQSYTFYTSHSFHPRSSAKQAESRKLDADPIWVARIRATRTLQEAWVCLLACKDQRKALTGAMYYAGFEKVIYNEERSRRIPIPRGTVHIQKSTEDRGPVPGDGKEVEEPSSSHNQAIITQEPIPTSEELFAQMAGDGIRPSGRFLEFLLNHARTYKQCVRILQCSALSESVIRVLLPWAEERVPDGLQSLETLPDWLFAAHIRFLCRFACGHKKVLSERLSYHSPYDLDDEEIYGKVLLSRHALKLVAIQKPFYLPCWNSLLSLLAQRRSVVLMEKAASNQHAQAIPKFHEACRLLDNMDSMGLDLDFAGFRHLCDIVKNASASARHILATTDDGGERSTAQRLLDSGFSLVKARFARLAQPLDNVLGNLMVPEDVSPLYPEMESAGEHFPHIPRLSRVPHPAHLHSYIRLLGEHPDYDGLAELGRWMSTFSDEIMEEAKETANGLALMRTCLIAIRTFLEQPLAEDSGNGGITSGEVGFQERVKRVDSVREMIGSNEHWGGWPTDEEVEQYLHTSEKHRESRKRYL
ncbi:MAG: hypothetical protein LQ338_006854 [Usnochroma carphineum]|nr:MAG: hypothetical protein LQ338_006854 [Usnochroma carphineum]